MNFVDCTLVKDKEKLCLDAREFKISLPVEISSKLYNYIDSEITMGIRPEELHESESDEKTTENAIRMTLDLIEPVGPYLLLHLKAGQIPFTATVKTTRAKAGQEVIMEIDPDKIHLFDKKTTKAIM
jgi:multiple sugar transport system ATP-binding protein